MRSGVPAVDFWILITFSPIQQKLSTVWREAERSWILRSCTAKLLRQEACRGRGKAFLKKRVVNVSTPLLRLPLGLFSMGSPIQHKIPCSAGGTAGGLKARKHFSACHRVRPSSRMGRSVLAELLAQVHVTPCWQIRPREGDRMQSAQCHGSCAPGPDLPIPALSLPSLSPFHLCTAQHGTHLLWCALLLTSGGFLASNGTCEARSKWNPLDFVGAAHIAPHVVQDVTCNAVSTLLCCFIPMCLHNQTRISAKFRLIPTMQPILLFRYTCTMLKSTMRSLNAINTLHRNMIEMVYE